MQSCRIIAAALALGALCSCSRTVLPEGAWEKSNHDKLNALILSEGVRSRSYDADNRPYAVFDFDNTTIINDVEMSLMYYQIKNLRFKLKPEEMHDALTDCLPDADVKIHGELTAAMLAADVEADYRQLYEQYIGKYPDPETEEAQEALKQLMDTDVYKDFCAKLSTMYIDIENTYDYSVCCLWILKLYNGFTYEELAELTKESCAYFTAMDGVHEVVWESPDMGVCGQMTVSHMEGIKLTDEMKSLYNTLKDNGFDVYICSASLEAVVEAMACDPAYGLNMDPEYVYGLRLADDGSGVINAWYDPAYVQTFKQGKTAAIKALMAPAHNGEGPDLVGGDSNGDYNMLTDFDDLKVRLIINCGNGGNIGRLAGSGDPKVALQGRDLASGTFVPSHESVK